MPPYRCLFHQRLKGGKVAPLDGVQQVAVVCDHLGKTAGGHGVQHPEAAVVGVGVLQGAPQVHFIHGGKPCPVQAAVGLVQLVVIRALPWRQGPRRLPPACGSTPAAPGCTAGRKIPQYAGFHGGALVDQLVHDAAVQPGDGGALCRARSSPARFPAAFAAPPGSGSAAHRTGLHSGFSLSAEPGRMVRSMISRSSTA